jgi:hypothetical protein
MPIRSCLLRERKGRKPRPFNANLSLSLLYQALTLTSHERKHPHSPSSYIAYKLPPLLPAGTTHHGSQIRELPPGVVEIRSGEGNYRARGQFLAQEGIGNLIPEWRRGWAGGGAHRWFRVPLHLPFLVVMGPDSYRSCRCNQP